jgi:hypothetical protein
MIFNLSLHRTATQACHDLFRRAGLQSCHWPAIIDGIDYQERVVGYEDDEEHVAGVLKPVFDKFTVVHDAPLAGIAAPLKNAYPNALFFCFLRPAGEWISSVRKHIGSRLFVPYERVVYWHFLDKQPMNLDDLSDKDLRIMHQRHADELSALFRGSANFFMQALSDLDPGNRLSRFCRIDPPLALRKIDYRLGHDINADPSSINAEIVG